MREKLVTECGNKLKHKNYFQGQTGYFITSNQMGPNVDKWVHMVQKWSRLVQMGLDGSSFATVDNFGNFVSIFWQHVAFSENFWQFCRFLATIGNLWQQ